MNDIAELKRFVMVHARAQNVPPSHYRNVLDGIRDDDDGSPDSWAARWSDAAEDLERRGRLLDACRDYDLARFPYVDGAVRNAAAQNCVRVFGAWCQDKPIEPVEVDTGGGRIRCLASGLSTTDRRPLLLLLGGIVTTKEQWAPVLLRAAQLGMAAVAAEMPGVGENSSRYTPSSHRMLSAVLDALADRADTAHTYAIALSFSGHLALRCATRDQRLRGIVTAGTPVRVFFTHEVWWGQLPAITVDTLAHLTTTEPANVGAHLRNWALTDDELAEVAIPVRSIVNQRDEVVPSADVHLLRERLRDFETISFPDVHGTPAHAAESRLWTMRSILGMRGGMAAQRVMLGALLTLARPLRVLVKASR